MKKLISLFSIALIAISCTEGDNAVDYVLDNFQTGAVLRTISIDPTAGNWKGEYNVFDLPGSVFKVEIEEHDKENGGLFKDVEVFVSYAGNEALLKTMQPGEFTTGPTGLPRASLEVSLGDALSALSLSGSDVDGGQAVNIRLQLNLTNGSSYTAKDAASSLTGSYFNSPYQYNKIIKCIPTAPVAGEYTLVMNDSYGDGWNGASLTVTIDGTATDYSVTSAQGASNTETFTVPEGTSTFTIAYNSGAWDSEVTYTISHDNGAGKVQTALAEGPNPTIGTDGKTMSICP